MSQTTSEAPPGVVTINVDLTAVLHQEADGGYSASIPALRGCHTQGDTLEGVLANLQEAAEGWLDVAHEEGLHRD
jgi:predicted RNase H-like HicB family nuclease